MIVKEMEKLSYRLNNLLNRSVVACRYLKNNWDRYSSCLIADRKKAFTYSFCHSRPHNFQPLAWTMWRNNMDTLYPHGYLICVINIHFSHET